MTQSKFAPSDIVGILPPMTTRSGVSQVMGAIPPRNTRGLVLSADESPFWA